MKHNILLSFLLLFGIYTSPLSAQWTKTKGLPGGSFEHFAQVADTTFAQHHAGIYFSTDAGLSWKNLLTYQFYWSGRLSTDGHNLLVRQYTADPSLRLMRSNDAGQSWIPIPVPADFSISYEVIAGPWVLVGTPNGAYRTGDNGANWELVHDYLGSLRFDGQRIFGWDANSVLASDDFGQSWQVLTPIAKVTDILVKDSLIMVFHYHSPNKVTASKDYGQTWEEFFPILPSGIRIEQMYNAVWHKGEVYGYWGSSIFKTADAGATWTETTPPNLYVLYNGLSVGDGLLAGGGANGIFRSTDGGSSWAAINEGLMAQSPEYLRSYGQHLYAPGREGNYRLAADAENWDLQTLDIPIPWYFYSYLDYAELDGNQIIALNDKPWFSTDGGASWSESTVSDISNSDIGRLELAGGKLLGWGSYSPYNEFFVSSDKGQTFNYLKLPSPFGTNIQLLDNDNGTLYAVSVDKHLFQSVDGGDHWNLISATVPIELFNDPFWTGEGLLYVRGNSIFLFSTNYDSQLNVKVLFSKDLGQTWELLDQAVAAFPWGGGIFKGLVRNGGYLIAGTNTGISYSSDSGSSWTAWNEGFQNQVVYGGLCIHDGNLWASLRSDGVWKRSLSDLAPLAVSQPQNEQSLDLFPNPTRDHFRVDTKGESGRITIQESSGRIVFEVKTSGQVLELDCHQWSAGVYFVSFTGETVRWKGFLVVGK